MLLVSMLKALRRAFFVQSTERQHQRVDTEH